MVRKHFSQKQKLSILNIYIGYLWWNAGPDTTTLTIEYNC